LSKSFLQMDQYNLFTFVSASHALKAERVLKDEGMDFIMIPTLREISASCGLSVKVAPDDFNSCLQVLKQNRVQMNGIYYVQKDRGKNRIQKIEI